MRMTFDYRQKKKYPRVFPNQDGFSLIELLIAFVIVIVTLAGVTASFRNFTKHSSTSFKENEKNAAVEATFQLLKRDLNMAGFGLVSESRLAEDNQFQTAIESDFTNSYDCNNDGDSTDPISEICYDYDLDGDGALSTAGSLMYRDRLFIANGWSILEDITVNGASDGDIEEGPPTDFYYLVANKNETGGYFATLANNVNLGATSVSVVDVNINRTEEVNVADDFKNGEGIILYGQDTLGTYSLEGHPITFAGAALKLMAAETMANAYDIIGPSLVPTKVVPATTWYVEQKAGAGDTIPWLYRNLDKVLPGVIGFQTSFGYDDNADGLEWHAAVPPTAGTVDTLAVNNTNMTTILKDLKAVRIVLTIRKQSNDRSAVMLMRTYEKTILLKN